MRTNVFVKILLIITLMLTIVSIISSVIYGNIDKIEPVNIETFLPKLNTIQTIDLSVIQDIKSATDNVIQGNWGAFEFLRNGINGVISFFGAVANSTIYICALIYNIVLVIISAFKIIM